MPKNAQLLTSHVSKAYHIRVMAEAACMRSGPVRLRQLSQLIECALEVGLGLYAHMCRIYPFCDDSTSLFQSFMVVPAGHTKIAYSR